MTEEQREVEEKLWMKTHSVRWDKTQILVLADQLQATSVDSALQQALLSEKHYGFEEKFKTTVQKQEQLLLHILYIQNLNHGNLFFKIISTESKFFGKRVFTDQIIASK